MKFHMNALALTLGAAVLSLAEGRPNFIVIQPDDFEFFEDWGPPAHFAGASTIVEPALTLLPNIESLRNNGLQMSQAYTASSMCGTSRFSTITGRYPSRSAYGRDMNLDQDRRSVSIPQTKVMDIDTVFDGQDCSSNNLAALFKTNNYTTGVVGKWHLYDDDSVEYDYSELQQEIRNCGFDYAEAIYKGNLGDTWSGNVTHNMEHVASKAIEFIEEANFNGEPFFLYFNPTVPHSSGNVKDALENDDCKETVEGRLNASPYIPYRGSGYTPLHAMQYDPAYNGDCTAYRQSVLDRAPRARGVSANHELGSIWIDDAIGAILATLEFLGELDNTFILFQMDHGQEGKGSLYEPGIRLAQFIHYPNAFQLGASFDGPVSTIDIGPTMLEYAGIDENSAGHYSMDGMSWKSAVENHLDPVNNAADTEFNDRCLIFELGDDRAIRCGCDKYMSISNATSGDTVVKANDLGYTLAEGNLFNLCDGSGAYLDVSSGATNPESDGTAIVDTDKTAQLSALIECHDIKTEPPRIPDYESTCGDPSYCQDFDQVERDGEIEDCQFVNDRDLCSNRDYEFRCMVTCDLCEPTTATDIIQQARNDIRDLILADEAIAPKFIRMGFHDAVGGVDGCIDMQNGDNAGLLTPIDVLAPIVTEYENTLLGVSRADIWALAALTGADMALPAADQGRFELTHIGRVNCEDNTLAVCPNGCDATNGPDRALPSPDLTTHGLLTYFATEFGFDNQETVALMGAHTLGRMAPENSGFDGAWVQSDNVLNNAYYGVLVGGTSSTDDENTLTNDAVNWEQVVVDNTANPSVPDRYQWEHSSSGGMVTAMTNSDIALVRDLDGYLETSTGQVSGCQFKCSRATGCPRNPTCPAATQLLQQMAIYKHDNTLWVDDFEAVMWQMMTHGYDASTTCPVDEVCVLGALASSRYLRGEK